MLGRIGSYEVTGVIGRGGMGVVFKAIDASLNRFVAIKMLLPHLATSGAARKRFSREGQAAAAVIDDHVLPIYGVNEWQGVPYLVTQYSSGMSLQKRIQEQAPLELKEILRISLQTARGLAAAHAQGLVHRDVKPSNILLDGTVERALLTDFGLARAVDDASITRSGTITGTPQFMAPEQARGEAVDQRSDLFSLGAVIYAMCTGHPPFRAETSYGVLRRITDDEPRPICEINPDIPVWLGGIVDRLMAKRLDDRFASASEVAELLQKCLAHVQQPATAPLPHSVIAKTPAVNRNHRWLQIVKFLGATTFALALLFAGILMLQERNRDTQEAPGDAKASPQGKQIATVLGKPVYEGDINKNVGDKDNLVRLLFEPLMEHYCRQQKIDRDAELKAKIKDEPSQAAARMFVMRAELNRHLYEKYGGRVQLTAFGPVAVDAQRKWLEDRNQAGDFSITDAKFQEMFDKLWVEEPQNAIFASPDQIKEEFDPAITERFIDNYAKMPAVTVKTPDAIDRALAGLSERVHHDFAQDGVPRDRFAVRGDDESEHTASKPDGLHVAHPGADGYSNTLVETLMRVHGNFDVTASFENFTFEPGGNGSGAISLTVIIENDFHTHASVQRGAMLDSLNPTWHFVQSEFVRSPQREPGVIWLGTTAEESTSGRLRLARVGQTLYCLFAAGDSTEFCLMHAEQVGPEDLLFGGIRLIAGVQSNDRPHGTTSVVWKDLAIRAERISDWPVADSLVP